MNPSCKRLVGLSLSLLVLVAGSACALPDDKNQPLLISADKQEISLKDGVVIYLGKVKLNQGTLEITADKVTMRNDKNQKAESVLAEGSPAHYQQEPEAGKPIIHAEASSIQYSVKDQQLILDKNVAIEQNGAYTKGGHMDYDITSQTVRASQGNNPSGRVETVIPPKTTDQ